jgi:hypothetical protein
MWEIRIDSEYCPFISGDEEMPCLLQQGMDENICHEDKCPIKAK